MVKRRFPSRVALRSCQLFSFFFLHRYRYGYINTGTGTDEFLGLEQVCLNNNMPDVFVCLFVCFTFSHFLTPKLL